MRMWFVFLLSLTVCLGMRVLPLQAVEKDAKTGQQEVKQEQGKEDKDHGEKQAEDKGKDQDKSEGQDELEAIRRAAAEEAAKETKGEDHSREETIFKSGGLGLQKLNPEISVTGDMLSAWQSGDDMRPDWDTEFRTLAMHFEAYLDPYSRFKAAVPISEEGVELGEAYFTRYGFIGSTNLTLGKFRQQFGVVNRWHKHALDTFDFPLALRKIFGNGGLNQVGLSLEANASTGIFNHGLIAQVTKANNPEVFAQNLDNDPSILAHYKAYVDLSPSTYLELGGSGLWGWNNSWETKTASSDTTLTINDTQTVAVYGVDFSLLWEPTSKMRYRNFEWRSEAYFADKGIQAFDGSGADRIRPWGLYSLMQSKVSRTIELGVRYDYYQPEARGYAAADMGPSLAPWLSSSEGAYRQAGSAWITWWESPFVKFRGGYMYETGDAMGPDVSTVIFQMVFAAGPHKHERY